MTQARPEMTRTGEAIRVEDGHTCWASRERGCPPPTGLSGTVAEMTRSGSGKPLKEDQMSADGGSAGVGWSGRVICCWFRLPACRSTRGRWVRAAGARRG